MILIRSITIAMFLTLSGATVHAAGEPWSDEFEPPPGDHSWIRLTSGEWLKGKISALYDEELVFDSVHFDDLTIELKKIESIHGRGLFEVTFRAGSPVHGTLNIRGKKIIVTAADSSVAFTREDLISITPSAERERDRWTGNIDFGMNVRRGNTEISEYSMAAGLRRRTPVSRITLDYYGNMNDTDGERVAGSHRVNLAVDRFTGRRLYWRPISVQYYKDELQNIRHQATADTGLGYHLIDTSRTDWELQAGVGANYLVNVSVVPDDTNNEWTPVGTFGSDLKIDITPWLEYEFLVNMTFLEEAAGKYQHHIVNTLSTDLVGNLDLDVSLIWDRIEIPQQAENGSTPVQDDYRMDISLSYNF